MIKHHIWLLLVTAVSSSALLHASQVAKVAQATRTQEEQEAINHRFRCAIVANKLNDAQAALDEGADINTQDCDGNTMLILAIKGLGACDIQNWLLTHGASPFVKNKKNQNAYDYAQNNPSRFLELLYEPAHKKTVTAVLCEIFTEHTPIYLKEFVSLIQEYALCGPTTENLNSVLFHTIEEHVYYVPFFLMYGADCNARNEQQQTALMCVILFAKENFDDRYACDHSRSIIKILLEYGADTSLQNSNGHTTLQYTKKHWLPYGIRTILEDHEKAQVTAQK